MPTGRERVLKQIKQKSKGQLAWAIVLIIGGIAWAGLMWVADARSDEHIVAIIMALIGLGFAVYGVVMLVGAVKAISDPMQSKALKSNPDLLTQADELFGNLIFQNPQVLLSQRVIANAEDFREMAYTDEVFLAYVYTHRTNGIVDRKYLTLKTARGDINLNIIKLKDPDVDALFSVVLENCRYAKAGYTDEGMKYVEQMTAAWKRDQQGKGKLPS